MKINVLFGIFLIVGLVFGMVVPLNAGDTQIILGQISSLTFNVALWLLVPLLFLQVLVNTCNLRFAPARGYVFRTVSILFVSALGAAILAFIIVSIVQPSRLPPVYGNRVAILSADLPQLINALVPPGLARAFWGDLQALPGLFLAGTVFGWALYELRTALRLVLDVASGLYRLVSRVNLVVVRLLSILVVIPVAYFVVQIRGLDAGPAFTGLLGTMGILTLAILFGVLPLILFITKGAGSLGTWLRLMFAPLLVSVSGGAVMLGYPILFRNAQNLRMSFAGQKLNLALFSLMLRAGTAMVAVIVFLVLVRSHTSLEMSAADIFMLVITTSLVAPFMGFFGGNGLAVLISFLAQVYGGGMGDSYLVVQGILPVLGALAVALDIGLVSFAMVMFTYGNIGVPDEQDRDGARLLGEFVI